MRATEIFRALFGVLFVTLLASDASAQFQATRPLAPKATVATSPGGGAGSFLGLGADDCNAPHTSGGTGDVVGVSFMTGTTGLEGQNEANCYEFGMTGIDGDVWFDWTANVSGAAELRTCLYGLDTKVAVYPGTAGCPADGASLACNDDTCGLQSIASWQATSGTTYTFQIGTFPGAGGGSGMFDVAQNVPCGIYDDGTSEAGLGLVNGGEIGWLQRQECANSVDTIETAYGSSLGGGAPANGVSSRIVCYQDPDCDGDPRTPAGGMTVVWSVTTATTNSGTDILNSTPAPTGTNTFIASGCSWVMATAEQTPTEYPVPMDYTTFSERTWVVGSTTGPGSLDVFDLTNNDVPVIQMSAIGFPAALLLRITTRDCMLACQQCNGPMPPPGTCDICNSSPCQPTAVPTCFGDGVVNTCPCGNSGGPGEGCANSTGSGAVLSGSGSASIGADSLVLRAFQTTNTPGVFFQGDATLGTPPSFGDGLRCCGSGVVRIGTFLPSGNTTDTATGDLIGGMGPPISQHPGNAGLTPGDTRCYQWWYRDSVGSCGGTFNLSNAVLVTWTT